MKIVVTGATGLLGSYLMRDASFQGDLIGASHSKLGSGLRVVNLTSTSETHAFLSECNPDVVIHTVALTNVDMCEKDVAEAYRLNVKTTENISSWIQNRSPETKLVYISTDQVYDSVGPHNEENISPSNIYSLTKLCAEDIVRTLKEHLVLRVNFFGYGLGSKMSLSDWIITSLTSDREIELFEDILFSPLYLEHLTNIIGECIKKHICGTYNLGASDGMNKADFARLIAQVYGLSTKRTKVIKDSSGKFPTYRPKDMRMTTAAIESALGHRMPSIRAGVELMYQSRERGAL